jgi:hypothetical protein
MSITHCPTHSCLAPSRHTAPDASADRSQTIDAPRQPQAYARLFPELPALEIEEELLYALGRQGSACDGRYEHRADIHLAFLQLGCPLISLGFLG